MTEQEYMKLTRKVKLNIALQLLGEMSSYSNKGDDITELVKGIRILESYHSKISIEIESN